MKLKYHAKLTLRQSRLAWWREGADSRNNEPLHRGSAAYLKAKILEDPKMSALLCVMKPSLLDTKYVGNSRHLCVQQMARRYSKTQTILRIIITCESDGPLDWIMVALRGRFGDLTEHKGQVHCYLVMQFDFTDDGKDKFTMPG